MVTWFKNTVDSIANWEKPTPAIIEQFNTLKEQAIKNKRKIIEEIEVFPTQEPSIKSALKELAKISETFERFISHIQFFQYTEEYFPIITQGELSGVEELSSGRCIQSLEDTKKRILKKEFSMASLFTLHQLEKIIANQDIIQDNKLILILSHNHATGLFKKDEQYYYFDPNRSRGEMATKSSTEIAKLIFIANIFDDDKPSPLGFSIFSFDEQNAKAYPQLSQVLDSIGPTIKPQKGYAYEISGLYMAADIGSTESAKYFLTKKGDPNLVQKNGWSALMLAINNGYFEIAKILLLDYQVFDLIPVSY